MVSERTQLVLLPGLDGSGRLFQPLLAELPKWIEPVVVAYPPERARFDELVPIARERLPHSGAFALLGESFSGPLALMLAPSTSSISLRHGLPLRVPLASFALRILYASSIRRLLSFPCACCLPLARTSVSLHDPSLSSPCPLIRYPRLLTSLPLPLLLLCSPSHF